MQFVRVTEPSMSMFSQFSWKGEVVAGKVKLKPGFYPMHFEDMLPVEHYEGSRFPNTAASVRQIREITESEFGE